MNIMTGVNLSPSFNPFLIKPISIHEVLGIVEIRALSHNVVRATEFLVSLSVHER